MTILAYDGETFSVDSRVVVSQRKQLYGQSIQRDDGKKYSKRKWNDGNEYLVFFLGEQPEGELAEKILTTVAIDAYLKFKKHGSIVAQRKIVEKLKELLAFGISYSAVYQTTFMHVIVVDEDTSMMELSFYQPDEDPEESLEGFEATVEVYHRDAIVAWGTGDAIALGAMRSGANSRKAVEIACKYIPTCGGKVTTLDPCKLKRVKEKK